MVEKDNGDKDGPSLEMPSLGGLLRRKKRSRAEGGAEPKVDPEHAAEPPPSEAEAPEPDPGRSESPEPPAPESSEAGPEPVVSSAPQPVAESEPVAPEDDSPTTILDDPDPAERPLFADETASAAPPATTAGAPAHDEPHESHDQPGDDDGSTGSTHRGFSLPAVPGRVAAVITGAVVGLLAVGATFVGLQGCEAVRGTSTCGGPGVFLLLAIMIGLIVFGGAMLRLWGVGDPVSTSFLAVGLLAVVVLLFLIDVSFSPWMVVVIPLVTMGTFALSHWVTTLIVDED